MENRAPLQDQRRVDVCFDFNGAWSEQCLTLSESALGNQCLIFHLILFPLKAGIRDQCFVSHITCVCQNGRSLSTGNMHQQREEENDYMQHYKSISEQYVLGGFGTGLGVMFEILSIAA